MTNEAKVKFTGDATGAGAAADKAAGGIGKVGGAAKKMGEDATRAAEDAAKAELKYEQEIQKSITRLKEKETRVKATAEAMKRLGMSEKESTRGAVAGAGGGGEGSGAGRTVAALGRIGGPLGGVFSGLGAGIAGGGPMLAAAGAAVALKVGFDALLAVGARRAEQEGKIVALEQERIDASKAARAEQGRNAIAAAQTLGQVGRQALVKGASIDVIQGIGQRTGASAEQSAELGGLLVGLPAQIRKQIEQAFVDAERLGGSGIEAARSLSADARESGNLGTQSRADLARAGLGAFGDSLSDNALNAALRPSRDLDNAEALRAAGTSAGRASQSLIANGSAVINAQDVAGKDASRITDPVALALHDISERSDKQIALLERQANAAGRLVEIMSGLASKLGRGTGGFQEQANNQRAAMAAAGGG